jgi:CMP/dCMP kinase
MNKIIITLDGHSGCGKSTLAKLLAKKMNYLYIDSGAMYRAVTLFFLRNNLIEANGTLNSNFVNHLNKIKIDFTMADQNGKSWVRLNEDVVEDEIRTLHISNLVSEISKERMIRKKMVLLQQAYAENRNVVMDGRDIGTVVFPNAPLKFWITASVEKRAKRRWIEFQEKNEDITLEQVIGNLNSRDLQDQNRAVSPLKKPEDSIEIDNSVMNIEETYEVAISHVRNFLKLEE